MILWNCSTSASSIKDSTLINQLFLGANSSTIICWLSLKTVTSVSSTLHLVNPPITTLSRNGCPASPRSFSLIKGIYSRHACETSKCGIVKYKNRSGLHGWRKRFPKTFFPCNYNLPSWIHIAGMLSFEGQKRNIFLGIRTEYVVNPN